MIDGITIANFAIGTAALTLMLIGLLSVALGRSMDQWSRRFFAVLFAVLFFYSLSNFCSILWQILPDPAFRLPPKVTLCFESLLSGALIPLLTVYLLHCTGEDPRKSRIFYVVCALFAVYVILLTVTQFTTFIYYYTPDNVYHRGPWYPLLLAPPMLSMLALLIALFRRRNRLTRKQFDAFLIFIIAPLLGMLIQLAFYGLFAVVFFTALAAMFLYVYIYLDQVEQYIRQREELAQEHTRVLAQQMRPHFIYNVLLSIYNLCEEDPAKAQQVILDFSAYLQQNFTAVVKEGTIPFPEELEHTRSYLAVETARYPDKLIVVYDTPHTRFRLPPLTLQPLVENCVRHGYDPNTAPLHIKVMTRETADGTVITVEDDGIGYHPQEDGKPHTALSNIRDRLELMCGGSLTIASEPAGGTTVTINLPKQAED